jgi:hypothetical protein
VQDQVITNAAGIRIRVLRVGPVNPVNNDADTRFSGYTDSADDTPQEDPNLEELRNLRARVEARRLRGARWIDPNRLVFPRMPHNGGEGNA